MGAVIQAGIGGVQGAVEMSQFSDTYRLKAKESQEGAQQAEAAARDAMLRGGQEAAVYRIRASQAMERARVSYANSGVDSTTGTPANVLADTRMMTERDVQTLQNNAAREALGYRNQAKHFDRQTQQYGTEFEAKKWQTILGGLSGAVAGGIGGARELMGAG